MRGRACNRRVLQRRARRGGHARGAELRGRGSAATITLDVGKIVGRAGMRDDLIPGRAHLARCLLNVEVMRLQDPRNGVLPTLRGRPVPAPGLFRRCRTASSCICGGVQVSAVVRENSKGCLIQAAASPTTFIPTSRA